MKIEEGCEETDYVKAAGWSPLFVPGCADFRRQGDVKNTPHVSSAVRCQVRSATDLWTNTHLGLPTCVWLSYIP